jgi:threonylcarbamoyladenosine tRNA methylthiotransferase CDKAL1
MTNLKIFGNSSGKKLFIKTYGCQANKNDSEILEAKYIDKGYEIVDSEKKADIILVNSCSVKNKTQSKIIDYLNKYYDSKKIIMSGCLINTINIKKQFPRLNLLNNLNLKRLNQKVIRKEKEIGIIQISQGCLNNCTYCATKLAKGKLKSYPIKKIKSEFESAISEGVKKIYLTSQDNGCYGFDFSNKKINLAILLNELVKIEGNYKIRVGMANPQHLKKFFPELLKSFESERVLKFLHIPVQSGSNKVLKEMKRGHIAEDFIKISESFRKKFPRDKFRDSTIATDIIVGYPTETEEDFEETLKLIKEVKPEVLNISAFSSRPRTEANKLKNIDSRIIKERTKKVNEVYLDYRKKLKKVY